MTTTYRPQPDGIPIIDKSPVALLDYQIDWATLAWLNTGETISSFTTTIDTGLTLTLSSSTPTGVATLVTLWLSGGTIGQVYTCTVQIMTSGGRTDARSFKVNVVKR